MEHYAGIDVSLECSSVCVVDANGKIVREAKVASEPQALIAWVGSLGFGLERIGLEAGPLSQWLFAGMKGASLAVELLETRHVRKAFEAMPVKSDRNDARGIAQLMRLGWFRPVHCKSMQCARYPIAADGAQAGAIKASRRGEQFTRDPARFWPARLARRPDRSSRDGSRNSWRATSHLQTIAKALLAVRAVLRAEFAAFEKQTRRMVRSDMQARRC